MIYRPITHLIGDIVAEVRSDFSLEGVIPFYDYGVTLEVVNRLKQKTQNPDYEYKKYPLIWYLIDGSIEELVADNLSNKRTVQNATVIICTQTDATYTSEDRFNNTFIPILRPLYDSFMFHLKRSNLVRSTDYFKHTYHENLFWGRDGLYGHTANIFDDKLDAIIIENLQLSIIEKC